MKNDSRFRVYHWFEIKMGEKEKGAPNVGMGQASEKGRSSSGLGPDLVTICPTGVQHLEDSEASRVSARLWGGRTLASAARRLHDRLLALRHRHRSEDLQSVGIDSRV